MAAQRLTKRSPMLPLLDLARACIAIRALVSACGYRVGSGRVGSVWRAG
jgi:hypothetical protein